MTDRDAAAERNGRRLTRKRLPERTAQTWRLVYDDLRERIVSLDLEPGDAINEKEIAASYGISRTPVREATLRLADEGLIEVFPQSGTFVSRIPYEELPEAMIIREAIETKSVRLATEAATRSDLMKLRSIIEEQKEADLASDPAGFHAADEAFHAEIARTAGYEGLWRLILQVKLQVDRYRRTTLFEPNRMAKVVADHEAIVDGIASRDPDRAAAAMVDHLKGVLPDDIDRRIARERRDGR